MERLKRAYLEVLLRLKGFKLSPTMAGNLMGILGCVLIGIGLFLISIPLGFICSGIMCIVIGSQIVTNGANDEYPR